MASQININQVAARSRRRVRGAAKHNIVERWQPADAARFLFKGQCYDARPGSDTTCCLCGECIRFVYVLKVIESSHSDAPEVGKLLIGECCFSPIKAMNAKLYAQLLAGAVNLRTYIEAIERDQRILAERQGATESDLFGSSPLQLSIPSLDEDSVRQWFQELANDGGDNV